MTPTTWKFISGKVCVISLAQCTLAPEHGDRSSTDELAKTFYILAHSSFNDMRKSPKTTPTHTSLLGKKQGRTRRPGRSNTTKDKLEI